MYKHIHLSQSHDSSIKTLNFRHSHICQLNDSQVVSRLCQYQIRHHTVLHHTPSLYISRWPADLPGLVADTKDADTSLTAPSVVLSLHKINGLRSE